FRYHKKDKEVDDDNPLEKAHYQYTVQRGVKWHGKAGKTWTSLRNSLTLKDVEKLLESIEVSLVYSEWRDAQSFMMIFSDGSVVVLEVGLSSGDVTGLRHLKLKTPGTICSVGGKGKTLFLCGRPRWLAVMPSPLATNPSTEPEPFPTSSSPQTFGSTTTLRRSKLSLVESFSLGGDVYEIPGRGAESEGNEVYLDDPVFPTAVLVCWKGIEGCDGAAPWHPTSSKILDSANVLLYTCDSEHRLPIYSLKWTPVPKCKSLFKHPSPDTTGLLVQTLRGPFCFLLFTGTGFPSPWGLPSLTSMYLKFELVSCAVSLLSAVGWNGDGTEAMAALSFICNKLMKASLTSENLMTIQAALGTFHASKKPLSSAVMARHGGFVRNLTRRFFLLLLK
ncbi:unnamed protein product, partial [Notodromas monacha]